MAATDSARAESGFYCSTSGTYFRDKESLAEHYKSDFHRYNLKRKVAGLPPVTKEWFEARKAQLSTAAAGTSAAAPLQRLWIDPLTKKKFSTENTYQAFVRSKKYLDLVRKSGQLAPEPVIVTRQADAEQQQQQQGGEGTRSCGGGGGHTCVDTCARRVLAFAPALMQAWPCRARRTNRPACPSVLGRAHATTQHKGSTFTAARCVGDEYLTGGSPHICSSTKWTRPLLVVACLPTWLLAGCLYLTASPSIN